jgi:hypothetical protein
MLKVKIPTFITIAAGIFMILKFFFTVPAIRAVADEIEQWCLVVFAMALALGFANILRINLRAIARKRPDWGYKLVLVLSMLGVAGIGLAEYAIKGHVAAGTLFDRIYRYLFNPLAATTFALLAFFIASAAFRAFRARNVRAALLLISATLAMLGRVPLGAWLWDDFPRLTAWIMAFPNAAGQRALIIGAAMGVVATGLRILFGIERPYLRGE